LAGRFKTVNYSSKEWLIVFFDLQGWFFLNW